MPEAFIEPLAQVAECHQRRKQYGQRQRHGHHRQRGIKKQLAYHMHFQALADQIVDIAPQELHQHYEQAYEKRHQEQRQETAQHESV